MDLRNHDRFHNKRNVESATVARGRLAPRDVVLRGRHRRRHRSPACTSIPSPTFSRANRETTSPSSPSTNVSTVFASSIDKLLLRQARLLVELAHLPRRRSSPPRSPASPSPRSARAGSPSPLQTTSSGTLAESRNRGATATACMATLLATPRAFSGSTSFARRNAHQPGLPSGGGGAGHRAVHVVAHGLVGAAVATMTYARRSRCSRARSRLSRRRPLHRRAGASREPAGMVRFSNRARACRRSRHRRHHRGDGGVRDDEPQELLVPAHEVRLRVHLHDRGRLAAGGDGDADQALGGGRDQLS